MKYILILVFICVLFSRQAYGQKQLILLKKEKVLLRLYPGDEIILKLKNGKIIKKTYVNNLFDGIVITHRDTIPFNTIDRIYFNQATKLNVIGGTLVFAGAALFVIDQVNNTIVHGNDFNLDDGVSIASISVIGVGLPMMLIKKKYRKINYKHRLMVVKKGSMFYRPDTRGNMSPFLDNQP